MSDNQIEFYQDELREYIETQGRNGRACFLSYKSFNECRVENMEWKEFILDAMYNEEVLNYFNAMIKEGFTGPFKQALFDYFCNTYMDEVIDFRTGDWT